MTVLPIPKPNFGYRDVIELYSIDYSIVGHLDVYFSVSLFSRRKVLYFLSAISMCRWITNGAKF